MRSIEKRLASLEHDIATRSRNPLLILAVSLELDGLDLEMVRAWIASGAAPESTASTGTVIRRRIASGSGSADKRRNSR